jgi:hypothetical protein
VGGSIMRFEYIRDGSSDAPLLRIVDFTAQELARLIETFEMLASRTVTSFPASAFSSRALGTLISGSRDRGVVRTNGETWEWVLTPQSWADVRDRARTLDALSHEKSQWLCEIGETAVLLSASGRW